MSDELNLVGGIESGNSGHRFPAPVGVQYGRGGVPKTGTRRNHQNLMFRDVNS